MAQTGSQAKSSVGTEMVTHAHNGTLESGANAEVEAQASSPAPNHTPVTAQVHAAESTAHGVNPARHACGG